MIAADGTATKSKFGANAILGVSMAVARRQPPRLANRCINILAATRPSRCRFPCSIS